MKRPSINHIYRLVWNESKNAYVPAAENTKTHAHPGRTNMLALLVSGLLFPGLMYGDGVVVALGSGATNVYNAPNGVPVINIDRVNSAGLSHNKFTNYNVGSNGLILNNGNASQMARQSQLAGQVMANTNLSTEARIILNEVVAPNRSQLLGYTEVLGGKADVVVANPYGITCDGCGFINTDRVTLTTGTPNFSTNGGLNGFSVNRGDILIQGDGLDALNQNYFDILARAVKIDAQINAKDLKIVTGTNTWDYAMSQAAAIQASGTAPELAIDSTALGGMYANRIKIIATEGGIGVRMLGEAAALADDFILTSSGKIELKNKLSAERDISLSYSGVSTNAVDTLDIGGSAAELAAKRHIDLEFSNGGITFSDGQLTAGEDLTLAAASLSDTSTHNAVRFAGVNMNIYVNGIANLSGVTWGSGDAFLMSLGTLNTAQGVALYSGADTRASHRGLQINVTDGMALNGTNIQAGTDLILGSSATDSISLSADTTLKTGADVSITAKDTIANSGNIMAGDDLTITAADILGTLTNTGTIQANDVMILGNSGHLLDITNQSGATVLSGSLSVQGDDISNAGTIQSTTMTSINASTLSNTSNAKLFVSTQNGSDGVINVTGSILNQGIVQSSGQLDMTSSSTITNSGLVLALKSEDGGSNEALNLSSYTLSNSGTIDGGGVLNVNVSATSGIALQNTGSIQSVDLMSVNSGAEISNSGSVIGDGSVTIGSNQSSFALFNTGSIQSGAAMTLGSSGHIVSMDNQFSGILLAGTTLGVVGGTLNNAGTIQATNGSTISASSLSNIGSSAKLLLSTVSGSDGSLTFSGTVDNQGIIESSGGLAVSTASTLTNSGTINASGNTDTLLLQSVSLNNTGYLDGSDVLNIILTGTSGTALNNAGQIHSINSMNINSDAEISNSGSVIGDGSVTIGSNQSSFTFSNTGRIQSGTAMTLGSVGHTIGVNNQSSGTLLSGATLGIVGESLDNQGKLYANNGMTLSLTNLVNGSGSNTNAVILGAMDSGASQMNITGGLDNYGAIHSNDALSIIASSFMNRSTGGLSSLRTLALNTVNGGTIDNYGALYAGNGLDLTALGGNIYNRSGTGTIDSAGTLNTNSATFTNNNSIVTTGDITITATSGFTNETTLNGTTITKSLSGVENSRNFHEAARLLNEGSAYGGADIKVMEWDFDRSESLNGITADELTAMTKAQIIANGSGSSLSINYGNSGRNYLALISAPTVNIGGSGTFTNEDLSLYKLSYRTQMIEVHDDYVGAGSGKKKYEFWGRDRNDASYSTNVDGDHDEWGQYHPGNGWSRFNHGDTSETWDGAQSAYNDAKRRSEDGGAAMSGAVTTRSFGAGIYASNFNFTSGTLSNIGSPWPNAADQAKSGSATTGSVDPKTQSNGSSESSFSISGSGSVATSTKSNIIAGSILSFAGVNLTLPSNPNGYFVVSRDPNAAYLIETNPLFAVGSTFVGSNYMAERYGINPDDTVRRLGDASYEAYMIRQQLIQQMGTNLIRGYGDEASQMQQLMDQAVTQGKELGFTYGKALTQNQIASLTEDIVWMEEVEVAGQKVLAPHVYLSQATKDSILSGAAISAENVAISGDALNNTGGTIQGSGTLSVSVTNDITNTSGNIQGGDVSLTSTEGSIVNQTLTVGQGNDTQYSTAIGQTAGITATGNLSMDANKDITVVGADVNAGGDASLNAGNNITFDTIVDKSTTSSSSTIDAGVLYTSSTNTTETSEHNIGSNLSTGGKLTIKSGNDTVIGGSNVTADGGMDVETGGSFKVEARQDKFTSTSTTDTTGIGVGGGVYGTETSTTDTFKGSNHGSTIRVGKAEDQEKRAALQEQLQAKAKTLAEEGKKLLSLKEEFLNAEKGSPEAKALLEQLKSDYAEYMKQLSEAKELKAQMDEIPSGDLNVKAGEKFVLQGSDLTVAGNASIDAKTGIDILDGLDEERTTTTTTTTTFLKVDGEGTNSDTKNGTETNAQADAEANNKRASASASSSAGASAETSSEHNVKLMETSTTTSVEGSRTSVASNLKVGGDLTAKTDGALTIQGSNLDIGGNASFDANSIAVLTGRNEEYSSTTTTTTSVGFYEESGANAGASADASSEADARQRNSIVGTTTGTAAAQAEANANAEANAESTITVGARTENSTETSYNLTNTSSTIKVGGNLSMSAQEKALFVGANVESIGNMTITAGTIENKAAQDISLTTSTNSTTTAGLYLGGEANAEANANANAGAQTGNGMLVPNGGAEASASASAGANVEVSAGLRAAHDSETTVEGSTTNVTNTFKSGGNFTRTATDAIIDQGTSIESEGDITQSARIIKEEEIHDTTFSSTDSQSHDARAGVYAGAEANAGASGEASTNLYSGPDSGMEANADAGASAGLKVSYEGNIASESSSTKTAITSKYKAGGSITSKSTESTTLIGTKFEAGKDINIEAGALDYRSAHDSSNSSSSNHDISGEGKMALYGTPGGSAEGSYEGSKEGENSTTAQTGSMHTLGNINIKVTNGDTNFEGTKLSGDNVGIQSTGAVNFNAAYDSTQNNTQNINAQIGFSAGGGEKGVAAEGGYNQSDSTSKTAQTGSINANKITINATKDITLEGTKLKSTKDTTIQSTEGDVKFKAATNTQTNSGFGVNVEAGSSKGGEGSTNSIGIDANAEYGKDVTSDTVLIQSGEKITVTGKNIINQEGEITSKNGTSLQGNVINEKATDYTLSVTADVGTKMEQETKNPKAGSKTTDDIPEKRLKASDSITKKYSAEAPETGKKAPDNKPVTPQQRKEEIQKLKEGWTKQKEDVNKALKSQKNGMGSVESDSQKLVGRVQRAADTSRVGALDTDKIGSQVVQTGVRKTGAETGRSAGSEVSGAKAEVGAKRIGSSSVAKEIGVKGTKSSGVSSTGTSLDAGGDATLKGSLNR